MTLLFNQKVADATARDPERWEGVLSTPSGFMVSMSTRHTGTTEGGKNWSRFREESVKFFSMRSGKLRVYSKERRINRDRRGRPTGRSKMGPIRDTTSSVIIGFQNDTGPHDLYNIGARHLGFETFDTLISKEFPLVYDFSWKPGILGLLRKNSVVEMSREILGKNYQKNVPRIIASAENEYVRSYHTQTLQVFQGIVPTDWIANLLVTPNVIHIGPNLFADREGLRDLRRFLRTANETQLRRLTRNPPQNFQILLRDTYRALDTLEGVDFRNLEDLHDSINARRRGRYAVSYYTPPEPVTIKYSGAAKKFIGKESGFSIIAPETTATLMDWSDTMHNCISGYGRYAAEGSTLLYAVMQEDKMVANMELDPKSGSIKQLLGKYNQTLDSALASAVKSRVLTIWPSADVDHGWE